jgi:chromate reductase, NAD(P)H dehydrogenase (quinone)
MSSLLFVSGSLRRSSVNTAFASAARHIAETHASVDHTAWLELGDLPFYNGDVESVGTPPSVAAARGLVRAADAVLICTPAYNGSPPGVLKNALDWLSRPAGSSALDGTVVATMSASPGRGGALDAQLRLREVLRRCGCTLVEVEPLVAIGGALDRCSPAGGLTDAVALTQITDLVTATLSAVRPVAQLQGALR